MALITMTAGQRARASDVNANFAICLLTDTARTCTVTQTWTASQTFTGGWTAAANCSTTGTLDTNGVGTFYDATGIARPADNVLGGAFIASRAAAAGGFVCMRANGTFAVPTAVVSTNQLGGFSFVGYDGTTTVISQSGLFAFATENWSATAHGTELRFHTIPNTTTGATLALTLGQNQSASFTGLLTATAGLTVSSGQTLTVTGATITGLTAASVGAGTFPSGAFVFAGALSGITTLTCTTVTATNLGGTLSTAAQANVTSLGTLTGLTMGGTLTMGANTLALASATVTGTPTWSSSQAITLSTAAQPNITSVGTLTSLGVGAITSTGILTVTLTSQQLALRYDGSNHLAVTVGATGGVTYNATGAGAAHTFSDPVTLSGALTYGGVTLSNAVTGTGNMVLSASPSLTGTLTAATANFSGVVTLTSTGAHQIAGSFTFTGNAVSPSTTGSIARTASGGMVFSAVTGTLYDFAAQTPAGGALIFTVPTGTNGFALAGAFGCNTKAPQGAYASGGALAAYGAGANGFDSGAHASELHALVVNMRAALVANGIMS